MFCRITQYMKPEWIEPNLKAFDKPSVLRELASLLSQSTSVDGDELFLKLMEREQKASTGADHGIAIPHATIESADRLMVVLGKSKSGVPFNALDHENSKLFFSVISPTRPRAEDVSYLHLISSVCRLMRTAHMRVQLMTSETAQDMLNCLRQEEDMKLNQPKSILP